MKSLIGRRRFVQGAVATSALAGAIGARGIGSACARALASPAEWIGEGEFTGVPSGIFSHGSRKGNRIALSFDACPTGAAPSFATDVVDFLEQERVAATFFVSGLWAEANTAEFRRLAEGRDFEIGLHGYRHPRFADASAETIRAEIDEGRAALRKLGARPVPLFRPPYFEVPTDLPAVARESGVLPVLGDAGLGDPDPDRTADVMERDAIRWVQAGSIIVLHVNGRGYATAGCVRDLVPAFRERGYVFVTVSELVRE